MIENMFTSDRANLLVLKEFYGDWELLSITAKNIIGTNNPMISTRFSKSMQVLTPTERIELYGTKFPLITFSATDRFRCINHMKLGITLSNVQFI